VNRQKSLQIIGSILVALLSLACSVLQPQLTLTPVPPTATPTISPLEARAGEWFGRTEFGSFSFEVSADGREITRFALNYQAGIASGSFAPQGEIAIPIGEAGAFDLSVEELELVFQGQFSEDGHRVSGLWEMNIPMAGPVSEEWDIER
jgi:hypothetical protein